MSFKKGYWKTADGRKIMIPDLQDEHLINIIRKFKEFDKSIPKEIKNECKKRGFDLAFDLTDKKSKKVKKTPTYDELIIRLEALEKKVKDLEKWSAI
jgi:hypothetical protein